MRPHFTPRMVQMLGNSGLAYLRTEAAYAWQALDAHLATAVQAMKADVSMGARAIRAEEVAARQAIGAEVAAAGWCPDVGRPTQTFRSVVSWLPLSR